jgi:hypothetical protein
MRRYPWVFKWVLPLGFLLLCAFYYQGTFSNCGDLLMSNPSDQTAGLIWLHHTVPAKPLWGFTRATNFPWGEWLNQPIRWSGALLYFWYWILSSLTGAICGYNLLNLIGFFSAAAVMYTFVVWLTRRPWVALLAGYAVAFTPYYQAKTSGHPAYVYQGVFVLMLWLFVLMWRSLRWRWAIMLGGLIAACFYFDPYFILITIVLLSGLLVAAVGHDLLTNRTHDWKAKALRLAGAAGVALVLLFPLAYIRLHYAGQINAAAGSRGEIRSNAQVYGARLWEYLAPAESHPVLHRLVGPSYQVRDHHGSNPGEYTINLSLTLIVVVLVAAAVLWRRRNRRGWWPEHLNLAVEPGFIALAALVVGAFALITSLPPVYFHLPMPSYFITAFVAIWRVFARLYVLVNISLVLLAALALACLWAVIKTPWRRYLLVGLVFLGVAFEYQIYIVPRPVWSFHNNAPSIDYRLANRSDIHSIAEYSLDNQPETNMPTYYLTFQWVHGKSLLNSDLEDSPENGLRAGLRTLSDPQTVPVLRSLGIDAVLVHGINGDVHVPGLKLIDFEAGLPPSASTYFHDTPELYPIGLYRVLPGPTAAYAIGLDRGFTQHTVSAYSYVSYVSVGQSGAVLSARALPGQPASGPAPLCFELKAAGGPASATIQVEGRPVWQGRLTSLWQPLQIPATIGQTAIITTSRLGVDSFLLGDLGCQ